jgi:hypothetical protein
MTLNISQQTRNHPYQAFGHLQVLTKPFSSKICTSSDKQLIISLSGKEYSLKPSSFQAYHQLTKSIFLVDIIIYFFNNMI